MKEKEKIKLFTQIVNVHYSTDYSSIDRIYPPTFVWEKDKKRRVETYFKKIGQKKSIFDLYIHFPYCTEKCWFCRHCSWQKKENRQLSDYLIYLEKEIRLYGKVFKNAKIGHIYFGGGTPTLFDLEAVKKCLMDNFNLLPDHQLNVESTFSDLDEDKIKILKKIGVNRLVLGVQSFDKQVLKRVNRTQEKDYFTKVINWASQTGIESLNAELMGGLPGQTYESFVSDLNFLINLGLDSLHVYSYMQTPKTALGRKGEFRVDNALKIKMIKAAEKVLEEKGYKYYGDDYARKSENRNASMERLGRLGVSKLALGVSAVGFTILKKWKTVSYLNSVDLKEYKNFLDKNRLPIAKYYTLNKDEILRSVIINNLRHFDLNLVDKDFKIYLYKKFKKEFDKLKKTCTVKEGKNELEVRDWLINSKIFYSKKILKKCKKAISREYTDISDEIAM